MNNPLGEIIDRGDGEQAALAMLEELEYLRYFYWVADFGWADGDVRRIIRENYAGEIPEGYDDED